MKYLLLPIMKLLWGVSYFIYSLIILLIAVILYTIWNLKSFPQKEIREIMGVIRYPGYDDKWARALGNENTYPQYVTSLHWIFKIPIKDAK